jgi:glutamate-1-semialdehyde aminotransferase
MKKIIDMNFSRSNEYRQKIHSLIPGGAHTYSKGDDQFPELAPAAIEKGKGAWLWDIDGNQFLDCSMGLSSVTLGHAFDPVLERVKAELEHGVNFQRPSVIEKEMAEVFLELVPRHQMIKFAKNGSIVTTAAVKLARAFTGRNMVAFPGDHPFYSYDDWFIGKTACNKGVPHEITDLSVTFQSNNLQSLEALFRKYPGQIACVITEPEKNFQEPDFDGEAYIRQAIELTHEHGALFIVDEMITGFKTDFPGTITKYDLDADMATWGKSIANGFSFCALTGKKDVMELGGIDKPGVEKVFLISTTHGGETHAIRAGLATIDFYRKNNVIRKNHGTGRIVKEKCNFVLEEKGLEGYISISDTDWMLAFLFNDTNKQANPGYRTLFMQEMIRNNVLFQGIFVPSFSHDQAEIDAFVTAFERSCNVYAEALQSSYDNFLIGQPAKPVFRRLV